MNKNILAKPLPFYEGPYQSGISDPKYALNPPADLKIPEKYDRYKGIIDKQQCCTILRANALCKTRDELKVLLKVISDYAYRAMLKAPSKNNLLPLDSSKIPDTYRVTVTIGFGYSLFVDRSGVDRFGLRGQKPKYLKLMPSFPGDEFNPVDTQSDFIINIASDSEYVNVSIARHFAEKTDKECYKLLPDSKGKPFFKVDKIEQGFGRPDEREFLRFNDGIDNLRSGIDLERLVYVDPLDNEPAWCVNGSYMVYRKIREMMPVWEAFTDKVQGDMIGRDKKTNLPLSKNKTGIGNLTPVYPDHKSDEGGRAKLNSHIRKVQPRREKPDLFGIDDLDRRFLRRPYPFFDGVDENGKSVNGLLFVAYMKSIQQQFEHVTNMWQMNEDFPVPGTGMDVMFAKGVLKTMNGGYYFCPPVPKRKAKSFLGADMFEDVGPVNYKIPSYVYGFGITFIDIDETVFRTFAVIKVIKDAKVVRTLDNQQFNSYKLQPGEKYDFGEFKNARLFNKSSKPITPIISRVKEIIHRITTKSAGSMVVFLTARSDFDNKEVFLNTFREYGIDMDSDRVYVERSGNDKADISVAAKKKKVVLKYLRKGIYRRARLIDDNVENLETFLEIGERVPKSILDKVRKEHQLKKRDVPISFTAYTVDEEGDMHLFTK